MIDELTGATLTNLGLIVREDPFNLPWDGLGEERLLIQVGKVRPQESLLLHPRKELPPKALRSEGPLVPRQGIPGCATSGARQDP